jgi:RNA polymerase sigma-70 factor (ECF subfamily)
LRPVPSSPDDVADRASEVEDALVARAREGDGRAWARLYQRHFDRVYRDLFYLVEDASTAEELVQETFASALVSLERFDGRSSLLTWLRGIGHNLVRKHWRKHVRRGRAFDRLTQVHETGANTPLDLEARHLRSQRANVLSDALQTLPASLREVFVLRDVQGLPVDEVAARLSITAGNVRVRANRARAKIREELGRLGWLEGSP